MPHGRLITLEGIDGAGKSTHKDFIQRTLAAQHIDVVCTREPGGTPLGEQIRAWVLDPANDLSLESETLLMCASRQEHIVKFIQPALAAGRWVLSDRFSDATFAYQGGGRGLALSRIAALEEWGRNTLVPDLTFLFDIDPKLAQGRLQHRHETDRFEREDVVFHQRVRQAYLRRAQETARFCLLDAQKSIPTLQTLIAARLDQLIKASHQC